MSKSIYREFLLLFTILIPFQYNKHYLKRYLKIISELKMRNLKKARGLEHHHIIPNSFGGDIGDRNMVYLSNREHFIIHHLLWKAFPDSGMVHAFNMMVNTQKEKITARVYEQLRNEFSEQIRKPRSEETKQRMRKPKSAEHRQNMSVARKGKPGKPRSEEHRQKHAAALRGFRHTEESKKKIGDFRRGNSALNIGMIWINNGIIQKMVTPEDVEIYYPQGFSKGRIKKNSKSPKKGTILINNGIINKMVTLADAEIYYPLGFSKGRLKK